MFRPRTAAVASLLLLPMAAGGFLLQGGPSRTTPHLFDQVLSIVANRYVDSLQGSALFEKAATGLVRELNDPYSELLAPKANEDFNRNVGGRYGGVGMLLEEQKNTGPIRVVVNRVFPHTPAEEGGVLEGDQIVRVDSLAVTGVTKIDSVSNALRGVAGTTVHVTYVRPGVAEPIKLSFKRAIIHVPAVPYATIVGDHIGYIPLQTFNENTAEEVQAAAAKLNLPMGSSIKVMLGFEHKRFKPPALNNMHATANWFEEINTPEAIDFKKRWHAKFPSEIYINDMGYNAYNALYMYKTLVEKAKSTKLDDLRKVIATGDACIEAPEGKVCIDPKSQHTSHRMRLISVGPKHEVTVEKDYGTIQPYWLGEIGCDLTKNNDKDQYTPSHLPIPKK